MSGNAKQMVLECISVTERDSTALTETLVCGDRIAMPA